MNYEVNAPLQSASLPLNIINYIEALVRQLRNEHVTLLDCSVRYTGEYSLEKIEHFLNYVEAYKTTKNISDEQSLRDLPHLLQEHAYRWWKLHEDEIKTWQEATQKLRIQFSHVKLPHVIYKEIFASTYNAKESFKKFVRDKEKLFEQLSSHSECTEQNQLDIIYGLLPLKIQNSLQRRDFRYLKELVENVESFISVEMNGNARQIEPCNNVETNVCKNTPSPSECNENEPDHHINVRRTEDGEPFIKVRATKDLMPHIKEEEHCSISLDEQQKFQKQVEHRASEEPEFKIDPELMNQITHIINNCDSNITETSKNHLSATSTNGNTEEEPNHTASIQALGYPTQAQTVTDDNANPVIEKPKPKRTRCKFCRLSGHSVDVCFKRKRKLEEQQKSQQTIAIYSTPAANQIDTTTSPQLMTTTSSSTIASATAPVLATTSDNSISKFVTYSTCALSAEGSLKTKLISAVEARSTKSLVSRLKNSINSSASKCHKCGTAGYYRSICPNCSPIYHYKPSTNR